MNRAKGFRGVLLAVAATIAALGAASPPRAAACEYVRVVSYEYRVQAYRLCVTKYDDCGNSYEVYEMRYRPVAIRVAKWVPIGD